MLDIYFVQCYLQNYREMLPKFLIFPSADGISRSKSTKTGRETTIPARDAAVTVHTNFLKNFKFGRNFPGNSGGFQSRIVPGTGNFSGFRRIPDGKWNPGSVTGESDTCIPDSTCGTGEGSRKTGMKLEVVASSFLSA